MPRLRLFRPARPSAFLFGPALALPLLLLAGCPARQASPSLVVYVSLDEPYSRPVLEAFRRETGINARPVYDTEANKSVGLAGRIEAEMSRPRAAVFWSSEVLRMVRLQAAGALAPYRSPSAEGIPPEFRDPEGHWTGFAARFRVLAYNTARAPEPPASVLELNHPRW